MFDKEIEKIIKLEAKRQEDHIELIASENYVSSDVLEATGSILTNKYAEGYPGKRYYDGTVYVDMIENLAIDRLKKLFKVKYANVQPHSGSQANFAAISALIKPGDKIMGLSLDSGGHLTHGYKVSFSGKFYEPVNYNVDDEGMLDYEAIKEMAIKEKPQLIICGYSAYSRTVDFKKFREIADACGAYLMADIAHIAGLIAADEHPSPVGIADVITSTTHKILRGARGGIIMTNDETVFKKINSAIFPGSQGGPLMHSIAGKAVAFGEALKPSFKQYILDVKNNANVFANTFIKLGAKVISGGTDTHLFIIDVKTSYGITGKEASAILQENNITINKNTIPNETESPFITSGIRLGTPAMTSRGFKEKEFELLGTLINDLLSGKKENIKNEVANLIKNFPIITKY
ncbi:MAG: serine hydroxymethyltransferase [Mycoplasmataceae bacterium]|nr:serine hydroxymethyltransferase [Mycoplasmataceae bacterium]